MMDTGDKIGKPGKQLVGYQNIGVSGSGYQVTRVLGRIYKKIRKKRR